MSMTSSPRGTTGANQGKALTGGNVVPKGYERGQLSQFTPEQMNLFQQMFGQVGPESYLGRLAGGDQSLFGEIEAPALQQFAGIQSGIANRFSGMGSGARRSGGFQRELGQAGSDFSQALQAQRQGLQRQALQDMMGISESLLGQRPYEQFLIKNKLGMSGWDKALGVGLPILGAGLGAFGGPFGAALGGQIGSAAASGFTGGSPSFNFSGIGELPTKWG